MSDVSTLERPPEVPIDPRIRARRIEVRRHEGRRRLARLVDLGLLLGVAALFAAALWTPLLDVDAVRVRGVAHLGETAVRDAAGIHRGDPLVSVDVTEVGRRVAALPWVAQVEVARGVEGEVVLTVTERTPVAVVDTKDGPLLVDREGRVLGPPSDAAGAAVVSLSGAAGVPDPGGYLDPALLVPLAIAARVVEQVPGMIASMDGDSLVATLAEGGEVAFGDASSLDGKLRSLETVLRQVDLTCLARIDLRLPGSPVLTREEGCS